MSKPWPLVPLGEILTPVSRPEDVDPQVMYRLLGAHWYAQGLYTKEVKTGSQIQAAKLYRVEEGDFVYNRLFAWKGSFALATKENHGCYVSNEFPCFTIKQNYADGRYLWQYFSCASVWEEALGLSSGGTPTSRNRLKEEKLLAVKIPLPPLSEQQRIVARIEELAAKIEEARGLRRQAVEEVEALRESGLTTTFSQLADACPNKMFQDVCEVVRGGSPRPAGSPVYYGGSIPFLKVADLTKDEAKFVTTYTATVNEAGVPHSRYVEPNTLMLTNSGATLGVPKICTFGTCFNDGIQAFLNLPDDVLKEYLYYFLRSKTRWFRDWAARGQGQPNLNTDMVKGMQFPHPLLPKQRRIVAYLDNLQAKIDTLKRLQVETAAELDALLPSVLDKAFKGEL